MAYTRRQAEWKNYPNTTTPIRAEDLNGIEAGLEAAAGVADSALSLASTAATRAANAESSASAAATSAASAGSDASISTLVGSPSATQATLDGRYSPRLDVNGDAAARVASARKNALTGWFHASGYGAVGNGVADDAAALQSAIDAAGTAGGGVVYMPEQYRVGAGLLLPSNVTLRGNNSGGQPGASGAYSRIVYSGPAGGTVISPKVRSGDTVNWGLHGLRIDGGGLADIIIEAYRVSYSRFTDLSVLGGQVATGVGVLFDSNVTGQCYFNVADNVKVDGLPTGVRFQRGANANRWQGGKIGNGSVGMEFLSLSAGNLVQATDFESASTKHVYIDAASNVFVGLHMEVAPIGYDITVNGNGTRRYGTTFATNVTTWLQTAATQAGTLDEITSDTYLLQVGATKFTSKTLSTTTQVNFDPAPFTGSASAIINFLRNVTTTGARQFAVYKGDGTGTPALLLDAATHTLSLGSVGLGSGSGVIGVENRITAPSTNPAAGGVAYAEAGALRWKTQNGTTSTVAGDVVAKSANYTATNADRFILGTGGASGITITLPAAAAGSQFVIKKVDSGAGAVTVATTSSQTIDGATTKALAAQWSSVRVVSDGTAWFIVG